MASPPNPSEIARETLRRLAARRMAPSPENYHKLYNEIAGTTGDVIELFPERELRAIQSALPRETLVQQKFARRFDMAVNGRNWAQVRECVADLVRQLGEERDLPWTGLLAEFLRQWEGRQAGLTAARKREAVERVLSGAAGNNELLFGRLQGLVKSWSTSAPADEEIPLVGDEAEVPQGSVPVVGDVVSDLAQRIGEESSELRDLFAYTFEVLIAAQLGDEPELAADARVLARKVRHATTRQALSGLQAGIKRFAFRLEILTGDRAELRAGLLNLLQLLLENVGELVVEDRWLVGQIAVVRDIFSGPINLRSIGDAELRLKEVIFKQSQLKHSLNEARESLKQMLAGFVDHLAEFADSTSDYHDKIEACAVKIGKAENITQLEDVLAEVIRETRIIQLNAQRSRDDLRATQQRVREADRKVSELQAELDRASALVRHDQLTGALNRRGLEEAFDKEVARAQRHHSTLCVAMLDIDNFKRLNDSLGHDAGDAALIHLATVIRETMRPQDTVARFGGEEFIIILPDTSLEDARKAIVRLQRELTRRIFLHDNNRQLITFSAGVSELRPGDTQASISKRADEAMYAAKQAGKNRVMVA
ncbi:MAG: diguanylate cyclase [Candidatus Accumulibacter sp.]|uniref:GGDEF domain-containing protein n=1 Tax=Accumulibacter sp. TaxID=2053492 RepID=UPI0026003585|nr:GGDEF domain-containing protein [Accumulibacter sp.]MCM8599957.1 diguanylate cyclase [Accumulibacter sp.]